MAAVLYVACILLCLELGQVVCIKRSDCPVGCDCDPSIQSVECTRRNWEQPPAIPKGTKKVRFESGNFGILKRTEACRTYNEVVELVFLDSNLTHINGNFFKCAPNLQTLVIRDELLLDLSMDMFKSIPNITTLNMMMTFNYIFPIQKFISRVCELKMMDTLRLAMDLFWLRDFGCLGTLPYLKNLYLKPNHMPHYMNAIIVKPLRNITNIVCLTNYKMTIVGNNFFKGFQLRILDLSENMIESIEEDAFSEMTNLETIDLSRNIIKHFDSNVFINLPNLQSIVMPHCRMQIFKQKFQDSQTLISEQAFFIYMERALKLQNTLYDKEQCFSLNFKESMYEKKLINLTSNSFFLMPKLVRLNLTGLGITHVDKQAINNQSKLQVLDLAFNLINNEGLLSLLQGLVHSPLKKLNLSGNPLGTLNGTFDVFHLIQLEEIILKRCAITQLQARTFSYLTNLKILDLSMNELAFLPKDVFANLTSLVVLHLERNFLPVFNATDLGLRFTNLEELYLEDNEMECVDVKGIPTFKKLDLSAINAFQIVTDIRYLPSLEELLFSTQKSFLRFTADFEFNFPKLKKLNFSHNSIRFTPAFFYLTPNIELLDLTSVSLSSLLPRQQKELLGHLTRLRKLYISNCDVLFFIPKMFENFGQLELLDANWNRISNLDHEAFYNLSKLTELHLEYNVITNVTWKTFAFMPRLRYLSLKGNPLVCTCEIFWLYTAVTTNRIVFIENSDDHICMSPSQVGGVQLGKLNLRKSDCQRNWLFHFEPLGIICVIMTTFALLFIAWRKRWQIRYTFFLAKAGLGRYEELHDDHQYIYDAFVAYSSNDLGWVTDHLMKNIDSEFVGQEGFRLCVHERDWLVGVDIVENIVKSIVESRKTILVLSKEFAMSKWCQFELATAHWRMEAEGHKKGRLLIILLDDIPAHLLTPRLVYFLSLKTYLEWPKDPFAQPKFWKTLRKSLRKELLYAQTEA